MAAGRILDPSNPLCGMEVVAKCPSQGCNVVFSLECLSQHVFSGRPKDNPHLLFGCHGCDQVLYAHYDGKKWCMRLAREGWL